MPIRITLSLNPDQVAALPRYSGRALHALFYQWLGLGDYALSVQTHAGDGRRPFAVFPILHGRNGVKLRMALLDDALLPALRSGIAVTHDGIEVLHQQLVFPEGGPIVECCTYPDLLARTRADTHINLHFVSPTSFRSREMFYPLPDPKLVFQSWLARWNKFAPLECQFNTALLDLVISHVALSRFTGCTERVDHGHKERGSIVGFTGSVQYTVIRVDKIDEDLLREVGRNWLRKLNVLANYAAFCGTGYKTTQGLGVTERV